MRRCLEGLSKTPCCLVICVWYSAHQIAAILSRCQFRLEPLKKHGASHKTSCFPVFVCEKHVMCDRQTHNSFHVATLLRGSSFLVVDNQAGKHTVPVSSEAIQTQAKDWCERHPSVNPGINSQINLLIITTLIVLCFLVLNGLLNLNACS